jgi:subtilisin family serine protease
MATFFVRDNRMDRIPALALLAGLVLLPSGSAAQIAVPPLGGVLRRLDTTLTDTIGTLDRTVRNADDLVRARTERLGRFVAGNAAAVEYDARRQPARRGELLVIDPTADDLRLAADAGYSIVAQGSIEGLDIPYAELAVPDRMPLSRAESALRRLLPRAEITADHIYFASGAVTEGPARSAGAPRLPRGGTVGVIDGGIGPGGDLIGQAGFAIGAPRPSAHAQAIRSLLAGAGTARLYVADIYGSDPAGGNALAIARALGWMIRQGVPVVSISLVGPANPLVRRAVELARAKGLVVVAAVGNDGPAAPAAYPASYPGVIAVTGVDRQNRVLFEAGKAAHLDYAAPGADLTAVGLDGRRVALRGTSFAAPLAASRIAAHRVNQSSQLSTLQAVDAEAQVRGPRVGRGILCAGCRSGT